MPQLFHRFFARLLRLIALVSGVVAAAILLAVGLAAAVTFIAWNLIRGRRPGLRRHMNRTTQWAAGRRYSQERSARPAAHDILDVEVREIKKDSTEPRRRS